ncbi:FHA domain-containing protein [Stenomitos frigidus]|uniref:Phosphopeptide-binding protein n=1 Tax=Stenomitos frigidus ULC18 TaxID=2107698 RepID=A0A2T1E964_9CYAN|nr:FHA domain-containing protein [Stenomitos frigidus]PSB29253.1 phosphopeptide-binding protein [Stenomitos frigidus ULC18]
MLDSHSLAEYSSQVLNASGNTELEQRLGLYRVFLKLYEHHRSLLDEILDLENTGMKARKQVALQYVQGVVQDQQVHVMTNLLSGKTRSVLQPQGIWVIGRDRKMALPIQDKRLSRRHAAIQYIQDQGFYLIDFNSTNGSFVNSEPVRHCVLLKDGDQIRLGSLVFIFFISHTPKTAEALPDDLINQVTTARRAYESGTDDSTITDSGVPLSTTDWDTPLSADAKDTSMFLRPPLPGSDLPPEQASYPISMRQQSEILDRFMKRDTPGNHN